jgi:hypothetical protein
MPIDYEIEPAVLVIRLRGQVSSADFTAYIAASAADPRYRSGMHRLILIDDDASFPPSREIIAGAARMPSRELPRDVRIAAVTRSPLSLGITSMFMGNAGLGSNYQTFETEAEAREWLAGS